MAIGQNMIIDEIEQCFIENRKMVDSLHEKLLNFYRLFLCTGGMPEAVKNIVSENLNIINFDSNIISSIIDAYIADMQKYTLNHYETVKIEKIYKNIPSQLAKENKKFQFSKIDKNARRRDYESSMDWLVSSRLIIPCYFVNRFETPLKGFMVNDNFKLYLSDCGILSKMLEMPYNKILLNEDIKYKGVIAENYVANELVISGHSIFYWAENQVAEIDFLIDTNDGIIPIEVKADTNKKSKSLNLYIKENNPKYAIRISANNFGFENGIKSVPLYASYLI
ncbi:MAG: DUF4143 domain-containing protein [Clostridia bacterium]|nr:DUF4143 domain-containing protein [Clostridia bacterium]